MDSHSDGGHCPAPGDERLNIFALVIYIPNPLGVFLDDLRRELIPGCNPHAHVSVLPPRPLEVQWPLAADQVRSLTDAWPPFEVELTEIDVFPITQVVYLRLGSGAAELSRMHAAMNERALTFHEPYPYHPHVTLAQDIPRGELDSVRNTALRRWREYTGDRRFRAERVSLVQNTVQKCWLDLAEYPLGVLTAPNATSR
ncbi:MAG: hypothetical protein C5B51_32130 [Terriglobia bacterium]|nr:MAG: hypothetical protein C5B51_32130 [Terriglobia bacterium]